MSLLAEALGPEPLLSQLAGTSLALLGVCLLAYVVLRFGLARLYGPPKADSRIQVLERRVLEPKRSLYLVRVDEHTFLLGLTEGSLSLLAELPSDREAPP